MHSFSSIAGRFVEAFHNFRLVSVAPVALPVYLLTADVLIGEKRAIPALTEFLLRAISLGLQTDEEIFGFLGISEISARPVLDGMLDEELVWRGENQRLTLSPKGRLLLDEMGQWVADDQSVSFVFDGLLRRPVALTGAELVRPSELGPDDAVEVRSMPNRKPSEAELKLYEVTNVVLEAEASEWGEDFNVLSIKRINRATRMCRIVTGLLFKANKGDELRIAFIAQGERLDELERVFTEKGGLSRPGFVAGIADVGLDSRMKRYLQRCMEKVPAISNVEKLQQQVAAARFAVKLAMSNLASNPSSSARDRLKQANARFQEVESNLIACKAREVLPYESYDLLIDALKSCKWRVIISSNRLSSAVLNFTLLELVEQAAKRGAKIIFVLTEPPEKNPIGPNLGNDPLVALERFRMTAKGKIRVVLGGKSEFYHVICDDEFAVVSNTPFLAFKEMRRTFRPYLGQIYREKAAVNALAQFVTNNVTDLAEAVPLSLRQGRKKN